MTGDDEGPLGADSLEKLTVENVALKIMVSSILLVIARADDDGGTALATELTHYIGIFTSDKVMPNSDPAGRAAVRESALSYVTGLIDYAAKH